jgi:hypothetical protein
MKKKRVSKEELQRLFEEVTSQPGVTSEVVSSMTFPEQGKPCKCGKKHRCSLGCMQHDYKHVVGYMCFKCHAQWFLEPDWRTDECRKADEDGSRTPL